jgi:hypothetical protein
MLNPTGRLPYGVAVFCLGLALNTWSEAASKYTLAQAYTAEVAVGITEATPEAMQAFRISAGLGVATLVVVSVAVVCTLLAGRQHA